MKNLIADDLVELYSYWSEVQGRLKEAEQINQLAVVPAINELRYAGRILVAALAKENLGLDLGKATNDSELKDQSLADAIVIAKQYVVNADHDISDALIYFFQSRADEINARYGAKSVIERVPSYEKFLTTLEKSRVLIIESRINLDLRGEHYDRVQDLTRDLIENYFILDKTDTFMGIEVRRYRDEIQRLKSRQKYLYSFAACSIIVMLLFALNKISMFSF